MMLEHKRLLSFVYLSAGLHVLVFCVIVLFTNISFLGDNSILGIKNPIKISQIQGSVRIDVVEMPRETLQELKAIEQNMKKGEAVFKEEERSSRPKEETIKEDDLVYNKEKKSADFMSMLKDISKKKIDTKKKIIDKTEKEKGATIGKNLEGEIKNLVLRGNQLSKGSGLTGGDYSGEMGVLGEYASGLPDHIRPYWRLPSYLREQNYMCRIRIFLRPTGSLIKASLYESSGNEEYDEKALKAVKEADPYPNVPNEIQSRVSQGDIILGFPL